MTITAEEVKARLDAGETINLVDVREPAEHAEFNIGGILLPLGKIFKEFERSIPTGVQPKPMVSGVERSQLFKSEIERIARMEAEGAF